MPFLFGVGEAERWYPEDLFQKECIVHEGRCKLLSWRNFWWNTRIYPSNAQKIEDIKISEEFLTLRV